GRDHSLGGAAVGQLLRRLPDGTTGRRQGQHRGRALRQKMPAAAHESVSLLATFLGYRRIILFEQVAVLRHELLPRIRVHLLAARFRQVAPDVLVQVGNLSPATVAPPAPRAGHRHLLIFLLLLRIRRVLPITLARGALLALLVAGHLPRPLLLLL